MLHTLLSFDLLGPQQAHCKTGFAVQRNIAGRWSSVVCHLGLGQRPATNDQPRRKSAVFSSKIATLAALALLMVCSAPAASAQAPQQASPQPEAARTQPQHEVHTAPARRGPGQELAHETREAAGEENDETAEFKQSASVQFVARVTGLSLSNAYLFCVVLNFVVVAGIIFWAGYKFLPAMFRARTAGIQKAMREAQKASEEARRKLAEIESRLMKLDVEIGTMRDAAEKEAATEEARIHAAAQEEARRIVESAQQEIAAAVKAARRALTAYAADLAVGLAQKQIRVDAATDQALLRNFAGELTTAGSSGIGSKHPDQGYGKDGN